MPTLHAYTTEMIRKVPGPLWREVGITSIGNNTIVSNGLAVGGWSNDFFAGQYAWRPDTTTVADKDRYITQFTASSGTLTNTSANVYSDQTATSENVIISRVEPYIVRQAIDSAVRRLKTVDRTEFPFVSGQGWYSLGEATWIRQPSDIVRICYDHSPQITRNRYLQKRSSVSTAGLPVPDFWSVGQNAATSPFQTTTYRGQRYYYALTRAAGVDATLSSTVSAMLTGVSGEFPVGETITAVAVVNPLSATNLNLLVDGGVTSPNISTSATGRQELTITDTLLSSEHAIRTVLTAQNANEENIVYELYTIVGALTDAVRRDNYPEYELDRGDWDFDQNGVLTIRMPQIGRGRFIVYSRRAYPGFDNTRLISGAADADSSDAPLDAVCAGALSRIYFGLEGGQSPNYLYWENQFSQLSRRHLYGYANSMNFVTGGPVMPAPRRIR